MRIGLQRANTLIRTPISSCWIWGTSEITLDQYRSPPMRQVLRTTAGAACFWQTTSTCGRMMGSIGCGPNTAQVLGTHTTGGRGTNGSNAAWTETESAASEHGCRVGDWAGRTGWETGLLKYRVGAAATRTPLFLSFLSLFFPNFFISI
jgi:hypothetical protein